ncbi:enoyl-CoA hydratase/isomerase family protein, partial [Lacticaseibacillus paracasei]|uniref:enoyl-CoA hydratase/isomerase family protein n=1 Tax=Lacticaseibacillus paracasei TaxID=1597 RepID=UPI0019527CA0
IGVEKHGHVTLIEIRRPPLNFFDLDLIRQIADALDAIDKDTNARAVVLASQGKAFCAGANFNRPQGFAGDAASGSGTTGDLYIEAVRIFRNKK